MEGNPQVAAAKQAWVVSTLQPQGAEGDPLKIQELHLREVLLLLGTLSGHQYEQPRVVCFPPSCLPPSTTPLNLLAPPNSAIPPCIFSSTNVFIAISRPLSCCFTFSAVLRPPLFPHARFP